MSEKKDKAKNQLFNLANAAKNAADNIGNAARNAATTVAENVRDGSEQLRVQYEQKRMEQDRQRLAPIFEEELTAADFSIPPVVQIVDDDSRRQNKVCEGSVGFWCGKDIKILCVYREFAHLLNLRFYPLLEEAAYYVDPCFSDLYIQLDEYFTYLKKMRVDELTAVAQDLGAKHVEIVLRASHSHAESQNANIGVSAKKGFKLAGAASSSREQQEFTGVEVAANTSFAGNDTPVEPQLVYFKNESDINALIKMRLDPANGNSILSKTYRLQCSNSSGIKTSDAQKIEASLGGVGVGTQHSFASNAANENNTVLEYTIVF